MSTLSKKHRKENPRSIVDNDSLTRVFSPKGPIATQVASIVTKEIVLERLQKEIVEPFRLELSVPRQRRTQQYIRRDGKVVSNKKDTSEGKLMASRSTSTTTTTTAPNKKRRRLGDDNTATRNCSSVLRSRLVMGTNQCTRVLERARSANASSPSLILLARDMYPSPTLLAHVPYLASKHVLDCPLLLLPGRASDELGKVLGVRKTSIVVFLSRDEAILTDDTASIDVETQQRQHDRIDSFIDFIVSKIQPSESS